MKKKKIFGAILSLILFVQCIGSVCAAEIDAAVINGCHSAQAGKTLDENGQLLQTSKAVVLYELNSDTLIYGWNLDEKIYPSSMVKLMTALVAYEQGDLQRNVTVSGAALAAVVPGAVSAGLVAGETLTLSDLLYCMLVGSANDASTVIAEHIGGNQENFARLMNAKAADLGCTGTNFTNAHGLHDDNSYTTVRDVLIITEALLEIPELKEMYCTASYTVAATNLHGERTIETTNLMGKSSSKKYYDSRVTGGKTGATDEAGRCLSVTAEGNGMELLAIVMGAEPVYAPNGAIERFGSFEEMANLLDYAFNTYQLQQVFSAGQTIAQFPVMDGENSVVVEPGDPVNTVLPIALDESLLTWTYTDVTGRLSAPLEKGEIITDIQVWYGPVCLAVTDLITMHAVLEKKSFMEADRIAGQAEKGSWSAMLGVFGILAGVAVVAVAVLFAVKGIRTRLRDARRRRRRIHRRRSR